MGKKAIDVMVAAIILGKMERGSEMWEGISFSVYISVHTRVREYRDIQDMRYEIWNMGYGIWGIRYGEWGMGYGV